MKITHEEPREIAARPNKLAIEYRLVPETEEDRDFIKRLQDMHKGASWNPYFDHSWTDSPEGCLEYRMFIYDNSDK